MSYQFIYTTSNCEADTDVTVVVRTQGMAPELEQLVVERTRATASRVGREPAFSYCPISYSGERYHLLASVRRGEADQCSAHHLILRESECRQLMNSDAFATPAGILLMLELQRFWAKDWSGSPVVLAEAEARFPGTCSAPQMCATWQVLTGSSEAAVTLQRPPYTHGCVVTLPTGIRARDMLSLLHESDAQSAERGWGRGMCVPALEVRLPQDAERLLCAVASPLEQLAKEARVPLLNLHPGLSEVQQVVAQVPTKSPNAEESLTKPPASPLSVLPVMLPCRYVEYGAEGLQERQIDEESSHKSYALLVAAGSIIVLCGAAILPNLINRKPPRAAESQPASLRHKTRPLRSSSPRPKDANSPSERRKIRTDAPAPHSK